MMRAIVIGQGYSGRLSIVRSVAEIGCQVILIDIVSPAVFRGHYHPPIDSYSKYVTGCYPAPNHDDQYLIQLLLEKCADENEKRVIIPDSDFAAAAVDLNLNILEPHFYCPHIDHKPGLATMWMDKLKQKELAVSCGLNVAGYVSVDLTRDILPQIKNVAYPSFIKPLISADCGKKGIGRCNSQTELLQHTEQMRNGGGRQALIEEYKEIASEYATLGFSDGRSVVIPGLLELLKTGHGGHFGVAVQGRVFPIDGYESLVVKFKEFVSRIGFVGLFDIDFYQSGNEFFFGELNLRFGGSGYAFTRKGANLPAMFVSYFQGEEYPEFQPITSDAVYFNERMAIDDWYNGYISLSEYKEMRKGSDICFIEDDTDPKPCSAFQRMFRKMRVLKQIRKWIHRA